MYQEKAIRFDGKTDDCVEFSDRLFPQAEKELGAFARAVHKLFGSAHVGQSIEDWVGEFESIDWPAAGAIPDWRRVTIAAAAHLASRVEIQNRLRMQKRRTTDDKSSQKERPHLGSRKAHRRIQWRKRTDLVSHCVGKTY